MKGSVAFGQLLLKILGIIPLSTTIFFYSLIVRIYFWNGAVLPYWKHPLKSNIPFTFHNKLISLLIPLSDFVALPGCFFLLIYLGWINTKWLNGQKKLILLIVIGVILYDVLKFVDPYGLFDWWLD